ncbi:Ribosomal protein L33 [Musa troglodytarum]|uniref:Large ribosomal subunit protein bL33c n=1 Tax=Musa troglodytarum TaxID=320322 RepID=A0A9E7JNU4_9LILI|nr:Ribosomal protein L33 [Musa troglodytarum]
MQSKTPGGPSLVPFLPCWRRRCPIPFTAHLCRCRRRSRRFPAAGTGFFYVKRKNPAKMTEKLEFRKYDPRVNKHVLFTEAKMKL